MWWNKNENEEAFNVNWNAKINWQIKDYSEKIKIYVCAPSETRWKWLKNWSN